VEVDRGQPEVAADAFFVVLGEIEAEENFAVAVRVELAEHGAHHGRLLQLQQPVDGLGGACTPGAGGILASIAPRDRSLRM
jgi:hypothetical protein